MSARSVLEGIVQEAIDSHTEATHDYVLGFQERDGLAAAIVRALIDREAPITPIPSNDGET